MFTCPTFKCVVFPIIKTSFHHVSHHTLTTPVIILLTAFYRGPLPDDKWDRLFVFVDSPSSVWSDFVVSLLNPLKVRRDLSLSSFTRDAVEYPLAGQKKPLERIQRNTLEKRSSDVSLWGGDDITSGSRNLKGKGIRRVLYAGLSRRARCTEHDDSMCSRWEGGGRRTITMIRREIIRVKRSEFCITHHYYYCCCYTMDARLTCWPECSRTMCSIR